MTVNGQEIYRGADVALAGGLQKIAEITLNFPAKPQAEKAEIAARFVSEGLTLENSWNIWLYPRVRIDTIPRLALEDQALAGWLRSFGAAENGNCLFTDRLTDKVFDELAAGRHVFLLYHRDCPGNQYYWPGALERRHRFRTLFRPQLAVPARGRIQGLPG